MGINQFSYLAIPKARKTYENVANVEDTRREESPAFYYSGRISDVHTTTTTTTETTTVTQSRTTVLAVFLLCILCCASLPMRENPEEVPTYLVHCTTCETSTSSCFLRLAPTISHTSFFVPFSLAYFTLREIIRAQKAIVTYIRYLHSCF